MEKCNDPQWAEYQLTKEEAINFAKSGIWKKWDDEKIVRFQLFQKKLAMDFSKFQTALSKVLGRDVFTHELANRESIVEEYLGAKNPPTFEEIVNMIPKDKRSILNLGE